MFFCLAFAMPLCASVYMCIVVTCWERAGLLALVCGVLLWVFHFPIGILGQVWYLFVSIPDLCALTYFVEVSCCSVLLFHCHKMYFYSVTFEFSVFWAPSVWKKSCLLGSSYVICLSASILLWLFTLWFYVQGLESNCISSWHFFSEFPS